MEEGKPRTSVSSSGSDLFLPNTAGQPLMPRPNRTWPWILATAILAVSTVILIFSPRLLVETRIVPHDCPPSQIPDATTSETCHVWRRSELKAAREILEHQDVQFTGNSAYDDLGRFFSNNPGEIDYVSYPSPEIDQAWRNLTGQRDFLISEAEAKELWPNDYKTHYHRKYKGYMVGLDVFHTLHCLDNLRRFYYPEVYPIKKGHEERVITHRGHCIDQIRQYVMCNADLTPYGMRWYPNPGRMYADSDVTHTCRNWDRIRDWTRQRYHAGGDLHITGVDVWSPFEDNA